MARSDEDSWDLASSVGATATMVAAARAVASRGPEALIDDPYADALVRAVGVEYFVKLLDGEITLEADNAAMLAVMTDVMAVRTRFFDDFFLSSGLPQAVILASGLDARAYRLPWPSGSVVYEIDQPEVIEFKTRTLADLGASPPPNCAPSRSTCATTGHARCATGVRPDRPNGLDRRGAADLSAARRAGPAVRQHHGVVGAGQPVGHRVPPGCGRADRRELAADGRGVAPPRPRPRHGRPVLRR